MAKTTATKAVNAAKAEISASKYTRPNKYGKWFAAKYGSYYKNCPWCGIFVAYVIEKICGDTEMFKELKNTVASVAAIYNWAAKHGYVKYSGKKGDLIIFDWTCGNGVANSDHVGFFVKDNGNGTITTIEGNTSSISDGNGDHVQQRVRDKRWVRCYVRLPYKAETTTTSTKTTTKKSYSGTLPTTILSTSKGSTSQIKLWQKFLNWALGGDLKVDGIFGTMTYKATKEFQRRVELADDGIVGEQTLAKAKTYKK